MNKNKVIGILMILIFIGSFITVSAANPFSRGAYNIQDFFRGSWRSYDVILLFTLLFILFMAAFMLALEKAFGETNRQIKTIAVVIALISSLSIVATTRFSLEQVSYIALGLGFLLLILLIQGILLKMGVKNKFAAFVLALLIALFLTFILAKLLSERPAIGRFGFFDLNLGKFKKGLDLKFPPIKDWFKSKAKAPEKGEAPTTTTTTTVPDEEDDKKDENGGFGKYLLLILILLILTGIAGKKFGPGIKKRWSEREKKEKTQITSDEFYEKVKKFIKHVKKIKEHIFTHIEKIEEKKIKILEKTEDIENYQKKIDHDPAYLMDSGSKIFKSIEEEEDEIENLIKREKRLQQCLKELAKHEKELNEKFNEWESDLRKLAKMVNKENFSQEFDKVYSKIKETYGEIANIMVKYFHISKEEGKKEEELKELFSEEHLKERTRRRWISLKENGEEYIKKDFENEKILFRYLKGAIEKEKEILDMVLRLFKYEEKLEERVEEEEVKEKKEEKKRKKEEKRRRKEEPKPKVPIVDVNKARQFIRQRRGKK